MDRSILLTVSWVREVTIKDIKDKYHQKRRWASHVARLRDDRWTAQGLQKKKN